MNPADEFDTVIIGGGVVGMSIAYGLARAGERVCVVDEGDDAFRAARGNFGLVWVQGKGLGCAEYAQWTLSSAAQWPSFAAELEAATGIDLQLSQRGGLMLCLSEEELSRQAGILDSISSTVGCDYAFDVFDLQELRQRLPEIGPAVIGATYCPMDGHVSPLRLLRALFQAFEGMGGQVVAGCSVSNIAYEGEIFIVESGSTKRVSRRLVLAAGLGNRALAPLVGLQAPVQPNRGQIIVTEKLEKFLDLPTGQIRQTGEGSVQIGDSKEDVGYDDRTTTDELARIADRALKCFPRLRDVNAVRTWGALRVMTPDGFPIYEASRQCPGAFLVTCHSGITLAAQHVGAIADWIRGGDEPIEITPFKADRFHVQAH